nr:unnamed protein product [Callosobruchus chinensis]
MDLSLMENSCMKIWYLYQYRKKYTRRCNIHEINKSRHIHGEFHHLYEQLRELPEKFYSYFRMNITVFDYILDKIKHNLLKKWTKFILTPINSTERLAVT